jgi:hypothetical protein
MDTKQQFLAEFKALLEKYDVAISAVVSGYSDTHGISGEKMEIYGRETSETWLSVDGWEINFRDIKAE